MRIGLIEFLLILAIASLTVGPRVALFVDRWMRRANRANAMAARRRAEYAAQMAIERDAMLKRFRHSYATKNGSDTAKAAASATIGSCMAHAVPKHMLVTMRKQNSRTIIE